ncbi:uncharacterized protein LOC126832912 [Adelges cooleyi]|uniref:uncharacterized protein LOC126832912 n=1 Tax=Adelges cooleyi TaxID=133065 RepID=UPI002180903E|nr:uncharacterized protein LOC126832912 [Adelges cooleyi]
MTASIVEPEPTNIVDQLHCYFSRYVHSYFMRNAYYFKKTFERKPGDKLNVQQLIEYGVAVKSHGKVVMAMLDELRHANNNNNDHYPKDLLTANFYLNNIYDTVHIGIVENEPGADGLNKNVHYKIGYKLYNDYIANHLSEFMKGKCHEGVHETPQTDHRLKALNKLTPKKRDIRRMKKREFLHTLQQTLPRLYMIFGSTLARHTYLDFHPKYLLFHQLLSTGDDQETVNGNLTVGNNKIHLLRDVVTNWRFKNGIQAKISDLYVHMKTVFEPGLVRVFQKQVLAAALHPVFMRTATYIHLVHKVFYPGNNKVDDVDTRISTYECAINSLGETLLGSIDELVGLKLFPNSVQKYLYDFLKEISTMVKFPKKKFLQLITKQWISWLLNSCSRPMEHIELEFYNPTELFEIDTNSKVKELFENTKQDIQDLSQYVKTLENYKEAFHVVVRTIDNEDMFELKPIDLLINDWVMTITPFVEKQNL